MPTGTERFAAVSADRVEILFYAPTRPFKQIGIVSAMGGAFSDDVAMYKQLRKAAADLGADAVLLVGQSQGVVTAPGYQITMGSANTTGTIMPTGYGSAITASTTLTGTTVGMPAMTFSYPKNQGIAIKYTK
jgi:hypothetical protein